MGRPLVGDGKSSLGDDGKRLVVGDGKGCLGHDGRPLQGNYGKDLPEKVFEALRRISSFFSREETPLLVMSSPFPPRSPKEGKRMS